MDEYTERKKAIELIQPHVKPQTVYGEGYLRAIEHATEILKLMPAADVQPIRRGRWLTSHPVDIAKEFKCTACGGLVELPVFAKKCYYDFCPNCGARMDGETE